MGKAPEALKLGRYPVPDTGKPQEELAINLQTSPPPTIAEGLEPPYFSSALGGIRTPNLLIRSQML